MVLIPNIQFRSILYIPKNYKIAAFQIMYDNIVHDERISEWKSEPQNNYGSNQKKIKNYEKCQELKFLLLLKPGDN